MRIRWIAARPAFARNDEAPYPSLTVALAILPGLRGGSPLGSASTCSMPLSTTPQTVYCRSRKRASSKLMKNWLLAEFALL